MVHESIIHTIREFKDINPRISIITFIIDNMDVVLKHAHVPMKEKNKEAKRAILRKTKRRF